MIHALHGNFGLPSDWDAALPPGIPAKAWHLWEIRRHHPETHTLTGFASWFNKKIETLPPDPHRVLAGYSMGGRLALHVLLDRPALWHRVLIISAHPGLTSEPERLDRLRQDRAWHSQCQTAPWQEVCEVWQAQPVFADHRKLQEFSAPETWRAEIADAFDGWSLGHQADLLSILEASSIEGYWLAGSADPKFSNLAHYACRILPSVDLALAPGAGHRILTESPHSAKSLLTRLHP